MNCNLQHIFKALELAASRHKKQYRKGKSSSPYINHLIQVTNILINEGGEEDPILIIGAILHDVVEDTVKNEKEMIELKLQISKEFGDEVLKLADKISNLREIINDPPMFWTKKRILDYFTWAEDVAKGLSGANDKLEMALNKCLNDGRKKYQSY